MKVLVINGDCIQTNTSANLCHIAYINGLVDSGHEVTLLCADGRDYELDPSIVIPKTVKCYTYYAVSLYEKIALTKKKTVEDNTSQNGANKESASKKQGNSFTSKIINKVKKCVLSTYGVHGVYAKFVKVAQQFYSDIDFDYVISISTPVTSHLLTHNLLKANHIKAKRWIQIWEDPWFGDAYGFNGSQKIFNEEKRLLSYAEKVCYVSPLTLKNRQKLFPESADKMYWQPLPYYYKNDTTENVVFANNNYGYFGDYAPISRDLKPFYESAKQCDIIVNICGSPSNLFKTTDRITINPRLPLDELKPIEDKTNVLVFLCNRKGGQIPGKIYQYSATYKTIIFILDGTGEEKQALKEYFQKFNRYVFCENTVEDITRAIKDIESENIGDVVNEPIEAFNPKETVRKILACENG